MCNPKPVRDRYLAGGDKSVADHSPGNPRPTLREASTDPTDPDTDSDDVPDGDEDADTDGVDNEDEQPGRGRLRHHPSSNICSNLRHHGCMAGGMNKRGGGYGSMAARIARSAGSAAEPANHAPPPPTIKHCWVTDRHGRLPGLLLEWTQRPDGWHARVVHAVEDGDGWVIVEEWLPAGLLEPAGDPGVRSS